jgi:hypothetical protein
MVSWFQNGCVLRLRSAWIPYGLHPRRCFRVLCAVRSLTWQLGINVICFPRGLDDSDDDIDLDANLALHFGDEEVEAGSAGDQAPRADAVEVACPSACARALPGRTARTYDVNASTANSTAEGCPPRGTPGVAPVPRPRRSVVDIFQGRRHATCAAPARAPQTHDIDDEPRTSPCSSLGRTPTLSGSLRPTPPPPQANVPRRSAADIFRGLPPVTQGPSANGPWAQDGDAHATPAARPCPVEQLAACVQRLTVVPSEAGGTTDTCQHFQCHAEIWACCVVRTCQRALCARHHGQSRCHEHGASPHTCPCLTCRPRQPLARLPGDSRIPPPNRGSEERRKRSLSSQRRSADVRRTRRATRDNACLIRALRALGVPVPLVAPGPFWALADGNAMLAPFHRHLAP